MAMKTGILKAKGWIGWPQDVGLGFSLTQGDWHCDLAPARNPESELTEWRGTIWQGTDREGAQEVWGDTHWTAAVEVELTLQELAA